MHTEKEDIYLQLQIPLLVSENDNKKPIQNFGFEETDLELVFSAGEIVGLGPDKLKNIIKHLTKIYCTSIGVEYMYIRDPERVKWIQNKININGNHPNFSKDQNNSEKSKFSQKIKN